MAAMKDTPAAVEEDAAATEAAVAVVDMADAAATADLPRLLTKALRSSSTRTRATATARISPAMIRALLAVVPAVLADMADNKVLLVAETLMLRKSAEYETAR